MADLTDTETKEPETTNTITNKETLVLMFDGTIGLITEIKIGF